MEVQIQVYESEKFFSITCLGLICYLGSCGSSHAGYINLLLRPGNNLIANQLDNGDDTLNSLFNFNIPEGTSFTKWDAAQQQFMPFSTYDNHSGWSINYGLTFGEGGELNTPSTFTNTFVGNIWPEYYSDYDPFVPPLVSGSGTMLLSCYVPFSNATFYDVVGRDPINGDSVTTLDALSQLSSTTTFENGVWSNGEPLLSVGQSAFFNLEVVPEPEVLSLFGVSAALIATFRGKRKR